MLFDLSTNEFENLFVIQFMLSGDLQAE